MPFLNFSGGSPRGEGGREKRQRELRGDREVSDERQDDYSCFLGIKRQEKEE